MRPPAARAGAAMLLVVSLVFLPAVACLAGRPEKLDTTVFVDLAVAPGGGRPLVRANRDGDLVVAAAVPAGEGRGASDLVVARIDPDDGSILSWMRLGGRGDERLGGMALDGRGRVLLTGSTSSGDFPLAGADAGRRVFLCRISADLAVLERSAVLFPGEALALALGRDGAVFLAGRAGAAAFSALFPQAGAAAGTSGFVVRVSPGSWRVGAARLLGGSGLDTVAGLVVDPAGRPVAVGRTSSPDFPFTAGAWRPRIGPDRDAAFAAILRADLSGVAAATAIDASGSEAAEAVVIDGGGAVVVAGRTSSPDFPSTRGDRYHGGGDCFVVRLSADLGRLEQARLFGGRGRDAGRAVISEAGTFIVVAVESESDRIEDPRQPLDNRDGADTDLLFLGPNLKLLRMQYAGTGALDIGPDLALGIGDRIILSGVGRGPDGAGLFLSEHDLY